MVTRASSRPDRACWGLGGGAAPRGQGEETRGEAREPAESRQDQQGQLLQMGGVQPAGELPE